MSSASINQRTNNNSRITPSHRQMMTQKQDTINMTHSFLNDNVNTLDLVDKQSSNTNKGDSSIISQNRMLSLNYFERSKDVISTQQMQLS